MFAVHGLLARLFDVLLSPLDGLAPWIGLAIVSAAAGVGLPFAWRWTSDPVAIRTARQRVQAHLLAVRLYRDNVRVVLRAEASFVAAFGRYLAAVTRPFLVLLIPFALLFAHLDARYARRALHPGERAIVKIVARPSAFDQWRLETVDGVDLDSPPVHITSRGEISWRIRARAPGRHEILFVAGERRMTKEVRVDPGVTGASARRATASLWSLLLAPAERPIDEHEGIDEIEVVYPPLAFTVLRWEVSWIVVFLVVSAAVAIALRRRIGVELW